ncbi:MAG: fimbria/pilus periplasmic chaperone [Neisseriaceae bacterium]|nr:fimbria/pilus periplasmic chaperone [Neisseriaceae bacterium]
MGVMLPAAANVVITGTRVIYPGQEKDVSVHLRNQGSQPVLVQVWLDEYARPQAAEAATDIPFVVMPPVFRMEPYEGQSVRIVYTQEPLPLDRESLFQFNVLEVPPSPEATHKNYVQLAFASKLKFFFRPSGLMGSAAEAVAQLRWTAPSARALQVVNPTPFHVSISAIRTEGAGSVYGDAYADEGVVVPPLSTVVIAVHRNLLPLGPSAEGRALTFTYINDYGVAKVHDATLAHP